VQLVHQVVTAFFPRLFFPHTSPNVAQLVILDLTFSTTLRVSEISRANNCVLTEGDPMFRALVISGCAAFGVLGAGNLSFLHGSYFPQYYYPPVQPYYTPPQQDFYQPPAQPFYTPPSEPFYTPPRGNYYTPPSRPFYTPPPYPYYTPPRYPYYTPPLRDFYTPPPYPFYTPPVGDYYHP
jgi:hypothetical protein